MLYVIYGNEPYALSKQVTAYKTRYSDNIYGFETCKTLADAVTFLTEFNVFCNDRAAYLEVDGISEISNKDSLYVMKKIQDLQDKKLLIYIRKVRSDAKGIAAIKETGCFIREYKKISNILNEEKVLDKTNWRDSTILNILENPIYKGDFIHGRRTKKPTYYFDVVEPLVSKEYWEECQVHQKKKSRSYLRTQT